MDSGLSDDNCRGSRVDGSFSRISGFFTNIGIAVAFLLVAGQSRRLEQESRRDS